MMQIRKRATAILLACMLVLTTLTPVAVQAQSEPTQAAAEDAQAVRPDTDETASSESERKDTETTEALELSKENTPVAQGEPASTEKTFTVTKRPVDNPNAPETSVGKYDTLWDVMANCTDGNPSDLYIVTMNKDYEITKDDTTWGKNGVNIVLRSAGSQAHTLSSGLERVMVTFDRGSTFETQNVIFDGKGKARFTIADNSKITLGKGTVVQNFVDLKKQGAPAIYLTGNSKLNILEGVIIQNNTSVYYGGAICAWDSEVNISGGIFQGNRAQGGGVIASLRKGKLNITGGTFEDNTATAYGGAVFTGIESKIEGATFKNNFAKWGGALYNDGNVTLTASNFTENQGMYHGGAIYQAKGKLDVKNTAFTKNKMTHPKGVGAAIYFDNALTEEQKIEGSTFSENKAMSGAGIYLDVDTKLDVVRSKFEKNEAKQGAAIATPVEKKVDATKAQLTVSGDSLFDGNRAYQGGALLTAIPTFIKKTTFTGNEALLAEGDEKKNPHKSGVGGAIYVMDFKTEISETKFNKNTAFGSGGAIGVSGVTRDQDGKVTGIKPEAKLAIVGGTSFQYNEATVGQGGAIYTIPYQYNNLIKLNDNRLPIEEQKPYANLEIAGDTIFTGNTASRSYAPPTNFDVFNNLKFSKNSCADKAHINARYAESILNNFDVNYKNDNKLITYNANGGRFPDGSTIKTKEYPKGERITILDAPKRGGHDFLYWKGSEHHPGDKYTVEDNHTFTAQWEKKPPKPPAPPIIEKIIVDPNGGTFSDGATGRKFFEVAVGKIFHLPAAPMREGYKFIAWKGTDAEYQPGYPYVVKPGGETFVAVWEGEDAPKPKPTPRPYVPVPRVSLPVIPTIPKAGAGK